MLRCACAGDDDIDGDYNDDVNDDVDDDDDDDGNDNECLYRRECHIMSENVRAQTSPSPHSNNVPNKKYFKEIIKCCPLLLREPNPHQKGGFSGKVSNIIWIVFTIL